MPFRNLPGVTTCEFAAGEPLIRAGERIDFIYYLIMGVVYRVATTEAGNENIMSVKSAGDLSSALVGILAVYSRMTKSISNNDFVAQTDCLCYKIPKDECIEFFRAHPLYMEEVLRGAVDEYALLAEKFHARREKNVSAQICEFLVNASQETADGRLLPKHYSNIEMAKLFSVHRVTVSNILRALKERGCITRTKDGILIKDVPTLLAFSNHEDTLKYKS
ncbi:MAG: Crp/Fnr family transcriptional regulator [Peptococcaceae bacterium]|nr:Crp/Fnr family transcriptional regulator [Peptococcaceae bacterium]